MSFLNKTKNQFFTIIFLLILSCVSHAQHSSIINNDTLKICLDDFNFEIDKRTNFILENNTMRIDDAIVMVRLANSIPFNKDLPKNDNYENYSKLFFGKYSEAAAKLLEAGLSRGMAYYSKDYNIYIGGLPHLNSMYY